MSNTPSMAKEDHHAAAPGQHPKPADFRSKVLAVGGVSGTYEELTGHKQELRVTMSVWALLGLAYANMAPTTAIQGSLYTALVSGGPIAVLWGWFIVAVISMAIAASLAELCSAWPHSAGQAMWAYNLAPPKWAPFLSFWTAWLNIAGGWALMAAGAYIFGSGCLALVAAFHPSYVEQRWHLVLVYIAMLLSCFVMNIFLVRILDRMTTTFALINISTVVATLIALAACTPVHATPSFVFTGFINETGWSSSGFAFLLGLLQSSFTIIGYDAATHLCEEAHDAGRLAPIAVVGGVGIVGIVGFVYIIALLFSISDVDSVLAAPVPAIKIFTDSFGLNGAAAAYAFNLLILYLACVGIICASSRAVWSMSRDRGFPLAKLFRRVDPRLKVPVWAVALQTLVPIILGIIYLGSEIIFYSFFQLTTIGYLASYFIPIALVFFRGRELLPPAYWRLPGPVAKFCNVVSMLYIVFICVLFCLPNYYPVTAANMNYTSAIAAVAVLFGTIAWYVEVRKHYKGPASQSAHVEDELAA
ncbi:hypothetical protein JCM10908_000621 [Rhodotorula pacifica]|uniref:uncharacterized protein n=1 Tax=Rhodotorula pacifica TaxID=1495444 RepID=UPI00317AC30D